MIEENRLTLCFVFRSRLHLCLDSILTDSCLVELGISIGNTVQDSDQRGGVEQCSAKGTEQEYPVASTRETHPMFVFLKIS